jgi:hypothetical protein
VGRDSSVGIATRYRLGGPEIESRWVRDLPRKSRPSLYPVPRLEDHPLSAVRDCSFSILAATLHNWRPFLHSQPEDAPCHGDRDPYLRYIYGLEITRLILQIVQHFLPVHTNALCMTQTNAKCMSCVSFSCCSYANLVADKQNGGSVYKCVGK